VDRYEVFEAWAPSGGRWTPWAKAIVFAHVDGVVGELPSAPSWAVPELFSVDARGADYRTSAGARRAAIVLDLPGAEGVSAAVALARCGWRPVPLYAALPSADAVVPMYEIVRALLAGAEELRRMTVPADAPPAFVLDARRAGHSSMARPGSFDNRSGVFTTDVPSASRLREAGMTEVVLVQEGIDAPRSDLARVLAGWQKAGIALRLLRADRVATPTELRVPTDWLGALAAFWWRLSLRGSPVEGFGGHVPTGPSSS
jgi:hypothetical protein